MEKKKKKSVSKTQVCVIQDKNIHIILNNKLFYIIVVTYCIIISMLYYVYIHIYNKIIFYKSILSYLILYYIIMSILL